MKIEHIDENIYLAGEAGVDYTYCYKFNTRVNIAVAWHKIIYTF